MRRLGSVLAALVLLSGCTDDPPPDPPNTGRVPVALVRAADGSTLARFDGDGPVRLRLWDGDDRVVGTWDVDAGAVAVAGEGFVVAGEDAGRTQAWVLSTEGRLTELGPPGARPSAWRPGDVLLQPGDDPLAYRPSDGTTHPILPPPGVDLADAAFVGSGDDRLWVVSQSDDQVTVRSTVDGRSWQTATSRIDGTIDLGAVSDQRLVLTTESSEAGSDRVLTVAPGSIGQLAMPNADGGRALVPLGAGRVGLQDGPGRWWLLDASSWSRLDVPTSTTAVMLTGGVLHATTPHRVWRWDPGPGAWTEVPFTDQVNSPAPTD